MGVKIFDLVPYKELEIKDLGSKVIAIDGNLNLYQFLSSIRQRDGTPLMDSHGNVTSHLSGLFNRSVNLLSNGVKPCYVFDGKSPKLKIKEQERRAGLKEEAVRKYEEAKQKENVADMEKYAKRTSRLTRDMISESKELLSYLGVPVVQAPSEGEAQAAFMVKNKDAYAVGSQDADSFLFGASRVVKNLAINASRKKPNQLSYSEAKPQLIELSEILSSLKVTQDQLIYLGMLIGTDFNVGGIKGIGPKNALKLVTKFENPTALFSEVKWDSYFDVSWKEVYSVFKNIPVEEDYKLEWSGIDSEKVVKLLCDKHEFSVERVEKALSKVDNNSRKQSGLNQFFK